MYEKLKSELKQIVEVVESVPDKYREKCFDLLLSSLLNATKHPAKEKENQAEGAPPIPPETGGSTNSTYHFPAKVRSFIKRYSITEEQLRNLVMVEENEVHFIHEPKGVKNAIAQIQWALLLALKSGLLGKEFVVDPESVRSICIDKGFYDKANFAAVFKRTPSNTFFNGKMIPQGEPCKLSKDGEEKLAEVLKELTNRGSV